MISISLLLEFEQLATESLSHDPETCHRLRDVLARWFTYDWDSFSESIKMVAELVRDMKPLLAYRYPLLLRSFNDILPSPFKFMLEHPLHIPNYQQTLVLLYHVQDRFRNEPWKYQDFLLNFQYMHNPHAPENSRWEAVARAFIRVRDEPDLLWIFCKYLG